MNAIRCVLLAFWVFLLVTTRLAAATLAEPTKVWAAGQGAKVFSGPGGDYYPTQHIPAGSECLVYQQLPDGWLAIRPPAGSYSLVLRSALEIAPGSDVARVKREATASRVGSVLSDNKNSVQVRLDPGESVQLIDDGAATGSTWATIAPPAGEFRYLREQEVVRTPPKPTTNWQTTADDPEVVRVSGEQQVATDADAQTSTTPAPLDTESALPSDFNRALDRLEIQLSRRISGPVNLWVFDDLQREAAQLMSQTTTPTEQAAVSQLAGRMSRFAAIGRRGTEGYKPTTSPTQSNQPSIATESNDAALADYDAVGVLRPVVSQQPGAPPYALVDDAGRVVTFVTPSPTENIGHLLGQRVGISGTRSFLPRYNSRNIQTARVAPVEGTLRR